MERLVGLNERPGRRLRGCREGSGVLELLVELRVRELYFVGVRLLRTEGERQRYYPDIGVFPHLLGQARRRVRNDRRRHSATICKGYNGCPPYLTSTRRSASRRRMASAILCASASPRSSPRSNVTTSTPASSILP